MACGTCGSVVNVREESRSYDVTALDWARRDLRELAWVRVQVHLRRCPECDSFYSHERWRDTDSGTAEEQLRREGSDAAIGLLLQALTFFPTRPKDDIRRTLDELLPDPPQDLDLSGGDSLALYQAERRADPALIDALAPHAGSELGARALAACGGLDALLASDSVPATRGLGRLCHPDAVAHLEDRLKHAEWPVRNAAAWALGEQGGGAEALLAVMRAPDEWFQVQETAAAALARVDADGPIVQALGAADWHSRWNTAKGIVQAGVATPAVVAALKRAAVMAGGPPAPQVEAVRALRMVGVDDASLAALLIGAMGSGDARFDRNLTRCLQELGT